MSEYKFKLPDLGEGTVESEIGEWFVKVGETVNEEDIVCTMMTDKAAVELSSPVTGKVLQLAGEPGDIVSVGAALMVVDIAGDPPAVVPEAGAVTTGTSKAPEPVSVSADTGDTSSARAGEPGETTRVITSPAIRRRAKEAGVDLAEVAGTGPGGRIQRKDFDAHMKGAGTATLIRPRSSKTTETKIIGLRRIIAERMSASKREIPHFSYVEELDITELEALRKHLNSKQGKADERLTLLPFLGLALIRAVREFPQCNATYDKERNVIVQHDAVHLGVATQTPDGLKVPVVRHAESHNLHELANEMRRVAGAARDNSAKKDELSGSTITITSLGKLGGIASTPVINMPEVGIIGVNRAVERPVVFNGQIAVRLMMNLSTSFDHRFVDGYDAAAMVQSIKEMLEHPATIFV
ncbi:MAG TPA: dihydrolipoamide acetyltransferase family protein [Woeseiaceae bacterium]|nr:dihydrolipoamide acetyltransferase family protein [Woeseiaceae bacterium]